MGLLVVLCVLAAFTVGTTTTSLDLAEAQQTVAFACGYRVHQDQAHHYDDLPILDWCLKIKATAATHGFNP